MASNPLATALNSCLYYFHDPMCSWCWGYQPEWEKLCSALPEDITVEYVLGGLAPDSSELMPIEQQRIIAGYWRKIEEQLGAEFNHDFWVTCQPRRSTYPACRAVIAARIQDPAVNMIAAIQNAYYLRALNPSNNSTLTQLASELGLNPKQFNFDLDGEVVRQLLLREIEFARKRNINSFPSLQFQRGEFIQDIPVSYENSATTLVQIEHLHHSIK